MANLNGSSGSLLGEGAGQAEREPAALVGLALRPDPPAMSVDDRSGDVQTEADAAAVVRAPLPEALEHGVQHVGGDAGTVVADRYVDLAVDGFGAHADFSAGAGELDGV